MHTRKKMKLAAVIAASIAVCLATVYLHKVMDDDAVYVSLFYIPMIMAGLWFYRGVIPLAVFFGLFPNGLDLVETGHITIEQVMGGLVLIVGAVILYYLERNLDRKNQQLRNSHHALRVEKERLRITLLSIGDGVVSTDKQGHITLMNEVAKGLMGWMGKDAIGKPFDEVFTIVHKGTRERYPDPVRRVLARGEMVDRGNHTVLIAKDGTERTIANSAAPILDENGALDGVVLVFRDVTSEKIRQDEIEFLSFHDELTGAGNRRYLDERIRRLDREDQMPISVIMGDVNGLKLTNDAFGHSTGDKLLQKAANALRDSCRSNDVICRYGGDEFLILLPRTDETEAEQIAMRLYEAVGKIEIDPVHFSISLGWATKRDTHESMMDTVKTAEDFMYKRKLYESPSTRDSIIQTIMNTLEKNAGYEMVHSYNISKLSAKIGDAFRLKKEDILKFKTACQYHDIGKIAIDQAILNKTEPLTEEEWKLLKRHPETGYRLLSAVLEFAEIAEYVLSHHERWDGKGYPQKLKGTAIPYLSRIISVAGSYDAMVSKRPYREPLSEAEAVAEIKRNAGTQFDPEVARIFVEKVLKREW